MAKKLNNPHDLLVKATLAKPKAIQEFAKAYFPEQLLKRLDPKSLKLTNKSYVTEDLKELHNDLVFSFTIQQQPGYAYTILEHQSTPDKFMPLRFIKYTVSLIEDLLKDDTLTQIPIITPICLYHSPERAPYPYTNNIYDLFADPSLAKGLKTFEIFNLVDLSAIDNTILDSHKHIGLMEKLLKYSRARDGINILSEELAKNKGLIVKGSYWKTILIYAIKVIGNQGNNEKKVIDLFKEVLAKGEKEIMETIAQTIEKRILKDIEKRGIEKGIEKGMEARNIAIAKNMLSKGLAINLIQEVTNLSKQTIENLLPRDASNW